MIEVSSTLTASHTLGGCFLLISRIQQSIDRAIHVTPDQLSAHDSLRLGIDDAAALEKRFLPCSAVFGLECSLFVCAVSELEPERSLAVEMVCVSTLFDLQDGYIAVVFVSVFAPKHDS